MTPVFELKNVNYCYGHKKVLENINIKVNKDEFLAVVGPNGAGKSTLLKLILGLLPLQSGGIFVEGINSKDKKTSIKLSYVSQKTNALNSGLLASVKETVLSGLTKTKRLFQTFNNKDNEKVIKVLERPDIGDLIHESIAGLSGGQQQHVVIVRALISKPAVLVPDEPTNSIDTKHVSEFYNTLDQLKQKGTTIILVTHDIGVVADTATEAARLNKHLHPHGTTNEFKLLDEVEISKIHGHPVRFVGHQHNRECCSQQKFEFI